MISRIPSRMLFFSSAIYGACCRSPHSPQLLARLSSHWRPARARWRSRLERGSPPTDSIRGRVHRRVGTVRWSRSAISATTQPTTWWTLVTISIAQERTNRHCSPPCWKLCDVIRTLSPSTISLIPQADATTFQIIACSGGRQFYPLWKNVCSLFPNILLSALVLEVVIFFHHRIWHKTYASFSVLHLSHFSAGHEFQEHHKVPQDARVNVLNPIKLPVHEACGRSHQFSCRYAFVTKGLRIFRTGHFKKR